MATVIAGAQRAGDRLMAGAERASGIPAKYSLPVAVGAFGLVLGGIGESTDIAFHVDFGRDESLLTVPHTLILAAITTIALAGLLALVLPGPPSTGSIRVGRFRLAPGGLVVIACISVALAAFPLDGTWHELFGEDLTLWSPTHLLLIGGPTLSILGFLLLLREGSALGRPRRWVRFAEIVLAGIVLGALTDLQSEFGFGVPQFRLLFHPVTVALTAGLALVFARLLLGRGGALKALAVYYAFAALPLLAGLLEPERTINQMPLYLVAALVVELTAARSWRSPLALGAAAGLGAGTVGLAAEWGWSQVWMPYPWSAGLLPEAALLGALAGTGGGVVGAWLAAAFRRIPLGTLPGNLSPALATGAALAAIVVALAVPLQRSSIDARATVVPFDTTRDSTRLRVALTPADAARDADWFRIVSIHGGSTDQVELRETGPGRYVSEGPVSAGNGRDVLLRIAKGTAMSSVTVRSNGDEGHEDPVALRRRSQPLEAEHALPPVDGWRATLQNAGYGVLGAIALVWLFFVWRAFALLDGRELLPRRPGRGPRGGLAGPVAGG